MYDNECNGYIPLPYIHSVMLDKNGHKIYTMLYKSHECIDEWVCSMLSKGTLIQLYNAI